MLNFAWVRIHDPVTPAHNWDRGGGRGGGYAIKEFGSMEIDVFVCAILSRGREGGKERGKMKQ
jgi:hypothetical protein